MNKEKIPELGDGPIFKFKDTVTCTRHPCVIFTIEYVYESPSLEYPHHYIIQDAHGSSVDIAFETDLAKYVN
jgi:hypothetical protein